MGFTSAGLPNGGTTGHYTICYDETLSNADGLGRAKGLFAKCEQDFTLMASWFPGVDIIFAFPLTVQIVAGPETGASWTNPYGIILPGTESRTIQIQPGSGTSVDTLRYLLVPEVTEMFMRSESGGFGVDWYEGATFFMSGDEGSKGEALSRFLGIQFQLHNGLGGKAPPSSGVTAGWLNSVVRLNFVDVNPDDHQPDQITGCMTLFLFYLHTQLGYSVNEIIAAGSSTLAGVYHKLTGKTDAWHSFSTLVDRHYPIEFQYNPPQEDVFPVAKLAQFPHVNEITCGQSDATMIMVDRPAMAELNIHLTSDDPTLVMVPPIVTIPPGGLSAVVPIATKAIAGPFPVKVVKVHASYAGKTLTIPVDVAPPNVVSLTFAPDTVTSSGATAIGTVQLNHPSLLGPVTVDLVSGSAAFASVPAHVTIPQNATSAQFIVTVPDIEVPFPTVHASISATYPPGISASAILTVKPKTVAGILKSLTVSPASISAGGTSQGRVTLVQAVPSDTTVGIAAQNAGFGAGSHLPLQGNSSSLVRVPSSITIPAGQVMGLFPIHTSGPSLAGQGQTVRIMAGAVTVKYAELAVE